MEMLLEGLTLSEITFKILFIISLIVIARYTRDSVARLNDRVDYLTDIIIEQKK